MGSALTWTSCSHIASCQVSSVLCNKGKNATTTKNKYNKLLENITSWNIILLYNIVGFFCRFPDQFVTRQSYFSIIIIIISVNIIIKVFIFWISF